VKVALPDFSAYILSVSSSGKVEVEFSEHLILPVNFTSLVLDALQLSVVSGTKAKKDISSWYCD